MELPSGEMLPIVKIVKKIIRNIMNVNPKAPC
jgi:hypothetical protein